MKLRILICAFACLRDPDVRFGFGRGGESEIGWNFVLQISKFADTFVLTDIGNKKVIEEKIAELKLSSIKFCYIGLPKNLFFTKKIIQIYAYLWQIKAYFIVKKLNKENNFDIFHHITYANDWMASFIGALLPVPYIRGPGGGAHRVPKSFVKKWPMKERMADKIRSIGQWFFRHDPFFILSQNKAKKILVCNKEAFSGLKRKWQKKAIFFPVNGVSAGDMQLARVLKNENRRFLVITAGKLLKIKGFDLAIMAFEIFNKKFPESEFIIVGDGPELKKLERMSVKSTRFIKWMPRKDLLLEIEKSDVFLFPSLRDGGGAVVVEAMAMAKPVVCFDIAGPGFHVDENCGIKIKPSNPRQAVEDLAQALEKMYLDKNLRERLGLGARKKAEENYNWDKLGERLKKIYEI